MAPRKILVIGGTGAQGIPVVKGLSLLHFSKYNLMYLIFAKKKKN
jgi:hypothetical protein